MTKTNENHSACHCEPQAKPSGERGFSFLEVIMVMVLVGVFASLTLPLMRSNEDAIRYEDTRQRLESLRTAIIGDPAVDSQGHRSRFGFVGDIGRLPTSLNDLVTQGGYPNYAFNNTYGVGAGWRGPYLVLPINGQIPITKDMWGNALTYSTAANPATITSNGGSGFFNKAITVSIPNEVWQGTVQGFVVDGNTPIGGASVEIRYPSSGTLTAFTTTGDPTLGNFSFSNVPFGVRALSVLSGVSPALGPSRIVVDSGQVATPDFTLDYMNQMGVTYTGLNSPSNNQVQFNVNSTYPSNTNLAYITVTSDNGATINQVQDNFGNGQNFPNVASGIRAAIDQTNNNLRLATGANTFTINFSANMSGHQITVTFEWTNQPWKDTIEFTA